MKRKLGTPKSTYRHNTQIVKYRTILTSAKTIWFWPSTHVIDEASFVKIASNSWQAEVIAHSRSYQTLWTDKNLARNHSTTKLVFKWTVTTVHSTSAGKGYCRIEKIIVSLSLSNLFSPNSNSFPMNSNIAETATVLNSIFVHWRRQMQQYMQKVCFLYIGKFANFADRKPLTFRGQQNLMLKIR